MRILPLYGHVIPTIGLVQELIKLGCEVIYMLPHSWEKRIQSSGAKFHGYDDDQKFAPQLKNAYKAADAIMADYDLLIYEGFFFMGKHLAAGVPIMVIPYGSDQPVNGQRVEKLGVGRVLNMRSITRKKLKDMVLSTFADDAMKKRAKDVLDMIARAPGNQGGALAVMAYYDKFQKS